MISPRLLFPMQMDQYFHQYLGWRLSEGGLPYLASFDQNFPGGAILHAISILLFGKSSLGFGVFDLMLQTSSCMVIARLTWHLSGSKLATIAAPLIYAFTYIGLGVWNIGQRDSFLVPFLALFANELVAGKPQERAFKLGALIGCMVLLRPVFALAFIVGLYVVARYKDVRAILKLTGGSALPIVLVLLPYAFMGELQTVYESVIQFNLEVYGKYRHGVSLRGSDHMTFVFIVGAIGLVVSQFWKDPRLRLLTLLTAIAPISTFIQGQGDAHHMTPSYALIAVLSSVGLLALVRALQSSYWSRSAWFSTVLVLVLILWKGTPQLPWDVIEAYASGKDRNAQLALHHSGDVDLREEYAVSKYLNSQLRPHETIYIWSMRVWPYLLTDRAAPSRFHSHEHLLMQPRGQAVTALQRKWRREFMRDLKSHPPAYILWTTNDQLWILNFKTSEQSLDDFTEFKNFVEREYEPDTVIGAFKVVRKTAY